jgi:hypothetical protein
VGRVGHIGLAEQVRSIGRVVVRRQRHLRLIRRDRTRNVILIEAIVPAE